ncbi:hypothetical protein SAMN04490244_101298 [Tranquillimonas rosea]|uniref:Uncharacterized protein n=1 Tax=Tranquillimonas rosea TaxID=641238 RepID=A0A1H9PR96_9RHOB|nr:hypothetical protein SAMN04490244_101298 [Tranquillimonas rosea]
MTTKNPLGPRLWGYAQTGPLPVLAPLRLEAPKKPSR